MGSCPSAASRAHSACTDTVWPVMKPGRNRVSRTNRIRRIRTLGGSKRSGLHRVKAGCRRTSTPVSLSAARAVAERVEERMKPGLVMIGPLMPRVMDGLAPLFEIHKLWEAADQEALLAKVAPT